MTAPPLHIVASQVPPTRLLPTTWPALLMPVARLVVLPGNPPKTQDILLSVRRAGNADAEQTDSRKDGEFGRPEMQHWALKGWHERMLAAM